MKKNSKLALFGASLLALVGVGFGLASVAHIEQTSAPMIVLAEGEEPEEPAALPCQVSIEPVKHGSVEVSITEGNVGDICIVTAKHELLYKVGVVSVNGTALVESETTSGEFSFALVEGENKLSVSFVVDEELCGTLTNIVKEASEKDWTNLFTLENLFVLIKWVLDGGILIAVIRYYVKDKKLAKKLENKVEETVKAVVPETTKNIVVSTIEQVITPMFSTMEANNLEIMKAMNIFAKCMALGQENTPEARRAILDELSGLKIGDLETIGEVKKQIEDMVARHTKAFEDTLAAIQELSAKQNERLGISEEAQNEEPIAKEEVKQATE